MAKFKKDEKKELPPISTASLPDIIFILLFFFMVVTVIRESELKVKNVLPQATELTKLKKKNLVSYIYIGKPIEKYIPDLGDAPRIQLNDKFSSLDDIGPFVYEERDKITESQQPAMTVALRIDRNVKMGIVSDVKIELRKANALKINYSAQRKVTKD